jgi:hypothetical protein
MIRNSYAPKYFLISTLIPIQKDRRKTASDSDNYRGISLSSVLCKLLDYVILNSNRHILSTSDMQFGFKPKHSTTQCTFVINEVIQYYLNGGSDVHSVLLDASKAFDRVHYVKLFNILNDRGMCPLISHFLAVMYTNQSIRVRWGEFHSEPKSVSNGVKQGGVISPVLFTVYFDELINKLRAAGIGCHIGIVYAGTFGYADDLTLLAPSRYAMTAMLDICANFARSIKWFSTQERVNILYIVQMEDIVKDQLYLIMQQYMQWQKMCIWVMCLVPTPIW